MKQLNLLQQHTIPRWLKNKHNARTKTIMAYVERETARTGRRPTIEECAATMAISHTRVEHHYRLLGYR